LNIHSLQTQGKPLEVGLVTTSSIQSVHKETDDHAIKAAARIH